MSLSDLPPGPIVINAGDIPKALARLEGQKKTGTSMAGRYDHDEHNEVGDDEDEPFDPKAEDRYERERLAERARIDSVQVQRGLDERRAKRVTNTAPGDLNLGLSGFDQRLLELTSTGMTLQEISEELNGLYSPAEVHLRVAQIIGSRGWLGYIDKQALLLLDLQQLIDHTKSVVYGTYLDGDGQPVFGNAQWADMLRKLLNDAARMNREHKVDTDKIRTEFTLAQGKMVVDALDKSFNVFLRELLELHPDIDENHARTLMATSFSEAIREVDKNTGDR